MASEFAKNRGEKIKNLYHNIALNQDLKIKIEEYEFLAADPDYTELLNAEKEIKEKISEYRKKVGKVLEKIRSRQWNDPVAKLYRELFKPEIIIDLKISREDLEMHHGRRLSNRIPPGFKESNKAVKGIGDVIICKTILQLGKEHKKPLIFITGDEKKRLAARK